MRDYQCHPLWSVNQEIDENIDPKDLPLSRDLIHRLERWAELFDKSVNFTDSLDVFNVPKRSNNLERAEELEGLRIWIAVRSELTQKYQVLYFFEGKLLIDPELHPLFSFIT